MAVFIDGDEMDFIVKGDNIMKVIKRITEKKRYTFYATLNLRDSACLTTKP